MGFDPSQNYDLSTPSERSTKELLNACLNLLQSVVHVLLNKLHSYHVTFFPLLECLHILTRHLPNCPLGSKVIACMHNHCFVSG